MDLFNRKKVKNLEEQLAERNATIAEKNTAITDKEATIAERDTTIAEKSAMIEDIFHRAKNDYTVLSSILNMESLNIHESAVPVLEDCISRISTMAEMNRMLYISSLVGTIKAEEYLKPICEARYSTFNRKGLTAERKYDFDDISLKSKTATYCGLLANEVIANTMKYAFDRESGYDGSRNQIRVSLKRIDDTKARFVIEDNGIGLPEGFDPSESESLGTRLISIFAKSLGKLNINSTQGIGTSYEVEFTYKN